MSFSTFQSAQELAEACTRQQGEIVQLKLEWSKLKEAVSELKTSNNKLVDDLEYYMLRSKGLGEKCHLLERREQELTDQLKQGWTRVSTGPSLAVLAKRCQELEEKLHREEKKELRQARKIKELEDQPATARSSESVNKMSATVAAALGSSRSGSGEKPRRGIKGSDGL